MALVDRHHRRWITATLLLGAGATAAYVVERAQQVDGPRGSTTIGLAFGVAAAGLMVFEAALNVRKHLRTVAVLGTAETWLKGHIWLGLLTVPLVFFHAGFRFGGTLTSWLTYVFLATIATGIYGLVLQQWMPKLMTRLIEHETVYEQIPRVIERLRVEAYDVASTVCGADILANGTLEREQSEATRADYRKTRRRGVMQRPTPQVVARSEPVKILFDQVHAFLVSDGRSGLLATPEGGVQVVEATRRLLPVDAVALHTAATDLGELAAERRDFATQKRMHWWLHSWLFLHVPLTVALFVLLGAHVYWALRYSTIHLFAG